ncbi:BQ2448_4339 [Microbotryum intermedium]|uniref:BQ2448_4339 protein n=1 Tax=Microbotryum intermedium TaxID=269621 RepID=A0A238FG65_9BASI|nr:BQ2448_4339 [Microbotryum intermedium]
MRNHQESCSTPRSHGATVGEPTNAERGASRSPLYWLVFALPLCVFGFKMAKDRTPATPAMRGMMDATEPKTIASKEAAGLDQLSERSYVASRDPKQAAQEVLQGKERIKKGKT